MGRESRLIGAAVPLMVGMQIAAPMSPVAAAPPSTITIRSGLDQNVEVSVKTYPVQLPAPSVIPLTVSTFVPPSEQETMVQEDFFDVDFGEAEPFIVPASWVAQFATLDPRQGMSGVLHEESE